MKKIFRMVVFSLAAIYLTQLWNQGFVVSPDFYTYFKTAIMTAALYYLVNPLTKLVLLPLNILTLGLISTVVYCLLFYFVANNLSLIEVRAWIFYGNEISKTINIFVSAISISVIINFFENML